MRKRYRILYGGGLLALGMSYIIGLILAMMSDPYPFQNSRSAPLMSIFPFPMMCVVGVLMLFVLIGMSGDDEEAMKAVRWK